MEKRNKTNTASHDIFFSLLLFYFHPFSSGKVDSTLLDKFRFGKRKRKTGCVRASRFPFKIPIRFSRFRQRSLSGGSFAHLQSRSFGLPTRTGLHQTLRRLQIPLQSEGRSLSDGKQVKFPGNFRKVGKGPKRAFRFSRDLCHEAWTNLRVSPMFGCICPNNHMKRRCDRIFGMVNHNPCVGKCRKDFRVAAEPSAPSLALRVLVVHETVFFPRFSGGENFSPPSR